ncbi:MAG: hypothetical protein ABI113_13375, partial [Mucilaginibacter sp.]
MDLQIIKNDKEHQNLLEWIDSQFDLEVAPESKAGQKLQIALLLIKHLWGTINTDINGQHFVGKIESERGDYGAY